MNFFRKYQQFRQPIQKDPDYLGITQYFKNILKNDSTIKSIFFASNKTDEYFDEQGRYEDPGYSAKNRPWWKNALKQNRLYCDNPSYDYQDSSFSTTMQMPVYDGGRLLGIGGIDILITTVSNEISQIRYENQGTAFLIDGNGECIVFPDLDEKLWTSRKLGALDSLLTHSSGFKELNRKMIQQDKGLFPVLYQGEKHVAIFSSIQSTNPFFDWRLGLLVPQSMIDAPIRRITLISIGVLVFFILCIFFVTLYIMYSITKPLNALAVRLDEIANQQSDLTIELPIETNDAIGMTARNFNLFVKQIRNILIRVLSNMKTVAESMSHLHGQSGIIADETKLLLTEAQQVTNISNLMMQHMDEITKGVKRVSQFSTQGLRSASQGETLVTKKFDRMEAMTRTISQLYSEMEKLKRKSENISAAIQTIEDVNEQISLLSVNASIEAVCAGEQGAGFAVLAEEIKNLSKRTEQANSNTGNIVREFHRDIKKLNEALLELKNKIDEEFRYTEELKQTFIVLHNDVSLTDQTTEEIKSRSIQQTESIRSINETIHQISGTIEHIANGVAQSFQEIQKVDGQVKELKMMTDEFKV